MRTCSVDTCTKDVRARGWCATHYARWSRRGSPFVTRDIHQEHRDRDLIERMQPHLRVEVNRCWTWLRSLSHAGYGQISIDGSPQSVHRAIYEYLNGPLPAGHDVHHLCGNRACANPAHLALLTHAAHTSLHHKGKRKKAA